jgi:hypothetical protein
MGILQVSTSIICTKIRIIHYEWRVLLRFLYSTVGGLFHVGYGLIGYCANGRNSFLSLKSMLSLARFIFCIYWSFLIYQSFIPSRFICFAHSYIFMFTISYEKSKVSFILNYRLISSFLLYRFKSTKKKRTAVFYHSDIEHRMFDCWQRQ